VAQIGLSGPILVTTVVGLAIFLVAVLLDTAILKAAIETVVCPARDLALLDLLAGSGIMGPEADASFFTLSKRKGLPHLSGSRPRDRRFHVEHRSH
jgi:hypothetical protein